jgi:hypothetical protein
MTSAGSSITAAQLKAYRARTYHLRARLRNEAQAVEFANERGFIYFWPISGVELPSLWAAVAGARPVADAHDDPAHVTWRWKDGLLGKRRWYYGKLLRGKATIVSLKTLPYFYALSENYGDMQHDYLLQYEEGRLTQEAKAVFEALLEKGALDTLALRREAHLAGKESSARFERALTELQTGLKILPVGVAEAGAWHYAFIYDLVQRHFPKLEARARTIGRAPARAHLARLQIESLGAVTPPEIRKLFGWKPDEVQAACAVLTKKRAVRRASKVAGVTGEWYCASTLFT